MRIDANAQAIYNAFQAQQVSANNTANVNTPGYKPAPAAAVKGDTVNIRSAARLAAEEMSATDPVQDIVKSEANEATVASNVKAIQVKDDMYSVLMGLNDPRKP